ncbi:MAG TPA: lipopolysaccharide kinase InaA family protein [Gemmatimonadaceae bacterium]|nr:lipopolysaccharide kinase InaA family protein [Gemmatimonadaceae bacterium]
MLRGADVTARTGCVASIAETLAEGTIYAWAAAHPERREFSGRAPVYAVPLPGCDEAMRVIVRRATHGGLFARLTGDLFLRPRAPHELRVSLRLTDAGVPTPAVIAYALYRSSAIPGAPLLRSDVLTREITGGRDLVAWLGAAGTNTDDRGRAIDATRALLASLTSAGALHPDLNMKNILIADDGDALTAWVLDVDRVSFGARGAQRIDSANRDRLLRSARKWRETRGLAMSDDELRHLAAPGSAGVRA